MKPPLSTEFLLLTILQSVTQPFRVNNINYVIWRPCSANRDGKRKTETEDRELRILLEMFLRAIHYSKFECILPLSQLKNLAYPQKMKQNKMDRKDQHHSLNLGEGLQLQQESNLHLTCSPFGDRPLLVIRYRCDIKPLF